MFGSERNDHEPNRFSPLVMSHDREREGRRFGFRFGNWTASQDYVGGSIPSLATNIFNNLAVAQKRVRIPSRVQYAYIRFITFAIAVAPLNGFRHPSYIEVCPGHLRRRSDAITRQKLRGAWTGTRPEFECLK